MNIVIKNDKGYTSPLKSFCKGTQNERDQYTLMEQSAH